MSQVLELQKDVNQLRDAVDKLTNDRVQTPATTLTPKADPLADIQKDIESLKNSMTTPKKREVNLSYDTTDLKLLGFAALGALATPFIGAAINSVLPQVPAAAESFIVGMIGYGLTFKKRGWTTGIFLGMIVTSGALLMQAIIGALLPALQTVTQTGGNFTL